MSLLTNLNAQVDKVLAYGAPLLNIYEKNVPSQLKDFIAKISEYNKYTFGVIALYQIRNTFNAVYPNITSTKNKEPKNESAEELVKDLDKDLPKVSAEEVKQPNKTIFRKVSELVDDLAKKQLTKALKPATLALSALYITYRNW
ncbi:MAG TPA: hypothetical protein PLC42_00765 [Parachlamydiaceae bacterium]|nr:hypothetical protein [Parachlamydiaceae bacterium]